MIKLESPRQSPQHRLLGGWRIVYDDVQALCQTIADIPEMCACHDGAAHLNGRCPCCGAVADYKVPACGTCDEQLARLRPAIDTLVTDRSRFMSFVYEVLNRHDPPAAERVKVVEREASAFTASFERLLLAGGVFRTDCRLSHMRALKDAAATLLRNAKALDEVVE